MVDSHALVGSCAQIGARVHLSAAAQIGGVLEPVGQLPVIIEDDVLIGGNTGIFEGVRIGRGAVIAAGVVLTGSTPVYDLVKGEVLRSVGGAPVMIPAGAVVVPGSRPASGEFAKEHGLQIATPLIVKYRERRPSRRRSSGRCGTRRGRRASIWGSASPICLCPRRSERRWRVQWPQAALRTARTWGSHRCARRWRRVMAWPRRA
jgi:hypothetical protein